MQRFSLVLLILFVATSPLFSQDADESIWKQKDRTEKSNVFESSNNSITNGKQRPKGDSDSTTQNVPIDGGISMLLIAGALYGGRRINRKRQSPDQVK